jgi:hypothetical protein
MTPPSIASAPEVLAPIALATEVPSSLASAASPAPGEIPKSLNSQILTLNSSGDPPVENALLALPVTTAPLQALQTPPPGKTRNGKIAHLPKLEREMVNRMLANNLSHSKIVTALQERGFTVTVRNVSNWKTRGGYNEWRLAQEHALELRTFQDNLTEFLRRHDASELPEVGLQSAATNLSAILLRPDLMRELISNPEKYSKLIELQCRLARELQALQKNRDDAARSLGRQYAPELLKRQNEREVERIREVMSAKGGKGPRDPDIPHRNFICKELEPVPPTPQTFGLLQLHAALAGRHPTPGPSSEPAK